MELVDQKEEGQEAQYWKLKVKEREEQRDRFFKPFRELLPPSKIKELEKEESMQAPQKATQ